MTTVGSLCTGYGGLELGLTLAGIHHQLAFVADNDPAATRLLNHHHPHVPNLGDITRIDWRHHEPVDWLVAGYPCQPFSDAGQRRGTADPRHLWPHIANAIRVLRPHHVLLENVRGHLRRGFPDVLADLATLGYVGSWICVRASDIGAPHRRERLFAIATDATRLRHGHPWPKARRGLPPSTLGGDPGTAAGGGTRADPVLKLLPTPRSVDATGPSVHGDGGPDLRTAVQLMPTPRASDAENGSPNQTATGGPPLTPAAHRAHAYAPAIARWAEVLNRPAPPAVQRWDGGNLLLLPRFVEWMMGLPDGHVTAVPRMTRNDALRLLGNGVVPQQAAFAVGELLGRCNPEIAIAGPQ